jgi:NAD(P)-dependent dehydrogenase (short-subunit alcohol dehydrogenase family)
MYNPFTLAQKTIFITGASSGIGRATAIECSKMGARVVTTGRDQRRLEETYSQLEGKNHLMVSSDFNIEDDVDHLVTQLPFVDGIVHCAGLTKNVPFQFATRENINEVLNINFYAPAEITRMALKANKISKNSSIVFISSISGIYCSAVASTIYSASKGAINGLVKGLALDLAPKFIRVNCVNPGVVQTRLFTKGPISQEQFEIDVQKYPLKRYGRPEEVAYAVIYLLSDASSWITGSNLLIDGGYTLL